VKPDDDKIDRLLARGNLAGPEYDRIFERVLARTETVTPVPARRWLAWGLVPGAAVATGLAAWLLLVRPSGVGGKEPGAAGFATRGLVGAGGGALEIGCTPSGSRVCRAGDTIMFQVNAAVISGYLGAYAERLDDPAHERIWYFTGAQANPVIVPASGTVVVPQGIRIGPEHRPGRYRVTAWIASRPLARAELDVAEAGAVRDRSTFDLEVVP